MADESPEEIRRRAATGRFTGPTAGLAPGYAQANLAFIPESYAFDFLRFCVHNPKPCPVLEVVPPGVHTSERCAPGADLRKVVPRYRVYENGRLVDEPYDAEGAWRDDLTGVLLGCSFTFERALVNAGVPLRHVEAGRNVAMYVTALECLRSGPFHGPMVVSMRPIPAALVPRAVAVSARYPRAHGAPVHVGDPCAIGIDDLGSPDFGDPPIVVEGDVPVFWACGVTPQAVAMASGVEFMITHSPGRMLVCDLLDEALAE